MRELPFSEFLEIVGGVAHPPAAAVDALVVEEVGVHSGRLRRGSAFFALPGQEVDGHSYVQQAFDNGAVLAVISADRADDFDGWAGPFVLVEDPLAALQALAAWWRSQLDCEVIAVVGSNGKTTTKDALVYFLGTTHYAVGSPGSYNSQLGVALSVLMVPAECGVAVIEAASVEPGAMARLERMVRPTKVVLTNLGRRNESLFPSRAARAEELLDMARRVPRDGWVLVGEADEELLGAARSGLECAVVLVNDDPRLPSMEGAVQQGSSTVTTVGFPKGSSLRLTVRHPAQIIADDVTLALSAACLIDEAMPGVLGDEVVYEPSPSDTMVWQSPEGVTVVREPATVDPLAWTAGLRTAREFVHSGGRLIAVLADPLDDVAPEALEVFAGAIGANSPDEVALLSSPAHETLRTALRNGGGAADAEGGITTRVLGDVSEFQAKVIARLTYGDVVLVHSPRRAEVDPVAVLVDRLAPTRLHVNLTSVESNLASFRRLLGPKVSVTAIVKALAYGTNAVFLGSFLARAGIDGLAVSSADEGVALRRGGVALPVLVLLASPQELDKLSDHGLTPVIYSEELLAAVVADDRRSTVRAVHLEVDTGMHRTGFHPDDAVEALKRLRDEPHVRLTGLMTHLACADDPAEDDFTADQLAGFHRVIDEAHALGFRDFECHAAATSGAIRVPGGRFDMVRLGLGLYGIHPSGASEALLPLDPAVSLVSRIVHCFPLREGDRVGYGGTYRAPAGGRRLAMVPIGYHDGIFRSIKNGTVSIEGVRCPIVGAVSMDSMAVDVTDAPGADVGSDVLVFGTYGGSTVPIQDLAEMMGTIPHEVLAAIGPRVQRVFSRH